MQYHYVYRITNIKESKHYYGVRSTYLNPIEDLGIKYFSSSKDLYFIEDQKLNPKNYKYKIVSIFDSRKDAIEMEIKLHNKFNVGNNPSFYNKAKQSSIGYDTHGVSLSNEHKIKFSMIRKGVPKSKNHKLKLSESIKGIKRSEETRLKMKNAALGYKQKIVKCDRCGLSGGINSMNRYHFDNCKKN